MPAIWRRIVVLLVVVIAVLQVIHMTLLSRLEARKNSHHQKESANHAWENEAKEYKEAEVKEDRAQMLKAIQQSSVLDSSGEFRIVNFLLKAESVSAGLVRHHVHKDVSLVAQCTANELHRLKSLSSRWHGPISVAVFTLTQDIPLVIEAVLRLRQCYPSIRHNTSFHLIYPLNNPTTEIQSQMPFPESCNLLQETFQNLKIGKNYAHGVPYPNNLLRNVARRNALTEFVFVIDIDLVPSDRLHEKFLVFADENRLFHKSFKDDKTVYVVPAYEMKDEMDTPKDKTGLLQLVELMEARPFYFELCWKCQKHTDYEAWQREPPAEKLGILFEVLWRDPWEPFYIGRNTAPFYDERFRQYGFNRISQVCELHVTGYKFSVLNNAFLVHRGLKTSTSFHKDKDLDQERNRILFRQFKAELKEKYPESSRKCY